MAPAPDTASTTLLILALLFTHNKGVEMYFSSQKNKLIPAEKSAIFPAIHSFG